MDVNVLPSINKGSLLYFTFTSLLQVLKHWLECRGLVGGY